MGDDRREFSADLVHHQRRDFGKEPAKIAGVRGSISNRREFVMDQRMIEQSEISMC